MDDLHKENFNLQIRKLLKEFGVTAHKSILKRFEKDMSECKVNLKLEIDSQTSANIEKTIFIDKSSN